MLRLLRTIVAAAALLGGVPLAHAQQASPAVTPPDPPKAAPAPDVSPPAVEGRSVLPGDAPAAIPIEPEDEDAEP
jgi:hypothetical protein